jgi:hypothetical protein
MVLLNGYLEWQPWMARAGGDLGHAMLSCHAHFPNRTGGDFRHAMPSCLAHSPNQVTCRVALHIFLTEQVVILGMPCLVALHTDTSQTYL